mmetsp:Transcript_129108/g.306296  ORF Transcript_129108/g.306296 Transcript_129108/m.306296 type:complete len:204 (-) Transcript_129108:226-837(-)
MEPKAKSSANFWGAMTMTGRKEKDTEMRKTPARKMPANWANLAGDMARFPRPLRPSPACESLSLAAPATAPAALAALSLASLALMAAWLFASLALFAALLPKSFAICDAALPRSEKTSRAWHARSAAAPKFLATSLCQSCTCWVNSALFAFSAAFSIFCLASPAAEATCLLSREAAFEKLAQVPASPFSASGDGASSSLGTGS